ncbi:MAG TPA: CpaF family protein [Candidatus Dormibacteraeota bacterium]|jgi:pilus assembly protein CpaF|nr:CpaF family protein [Candidatus Dormibacteraeota bacterium]
MTAPPDARPDVLHADAVRERLARELPALAALSSGARRRPLAELVDSWFAAAAGEGDVTAELIADLVGAGPLGCLLADEHVTEIMVNGPHTVHIEVDGRLAESDVRFRDEHHLRAVIDRLLAGTGRRLDESTPTVDAVLSDGSRLNAVLPPVAVGGPLLTIRRPRACRLRLVDLVRGGAVSPPLAAFLHAAVVGRCNMLVSGGTGAGKTTLLAALANLVPPDQRIVTIEDVAELRIDHPHVAAQQSRDGVVDSVAPIDMRALLRNTLRMRPDRIVVGEVRGAEAADMVAAMSTGHPGSMSTVHANSAHDALSRLETMLALAWPGVPAHTTRAWLTAAVDVIVHCDRGRSGHRSVTEVVAMDGHNQVPIYSSTDDGPTTVAPPPRRCLDRMAAHGVDFSPDLLQARHVA